MVYNNISVKEIIVKVFTDNDLQEGNHRIADFIEWAGEALEKIGAFPQFTNKVAGKDNNPLLVIGNYQTKLPSDFYKLIQVAYSENQSGPFYPIRYATGSFDYGSTLNTDDTSSTTVTMPESSLVTIAMSLYDMTYVQALAKINSEPAIRSLLNGMLVEMDTSAKYTSGGSTDATIDITYLITPGYIKTNVKTGYVLLAYQAIPTDTDGYPLVPDDISFKEALYWYITMKLLYPEWKRGSVRDAVYYDARRSWNYYSKQAYGNALMPNKDQLESIKNSWLRLVPEILEHDNSYSTLGQRQVIYQS